jgi:hypothetical protein
VQVNVKSALGQIACPDFRSGRILSDLVDLQVKFGRSQGRLINPKVITNGRVGDDCLE